MSSTNADKGFKNSFISLVEENLSDPSFGAKEICAAMGHSRVQLYRKVKKIMGYSVNDYIQSVRLKKAKQLLHDHELSISEIAYKVGYSSPSYFSTAFKSKYELTPSEFRAQIPSP